MTSPELSRYSLPSILILLSCIPLFFCGLLLLLLGVLVLVKPPASLPLYLLDPLVFPLQAGVVSCGLCLVIISCGGMAAATTQKRAATAIVSPDTKYTNIYDFSTFDIGLILTCFGPYLVIFKIEVTSK